jgi:hypothetical protein
MDPTPPYLTIVPAEVDRVARCWEEQHLDLRAAARQVSDAPTTGFGPTVTSAADDFVAAWGQHLAALARTAESTGVRLRSATASFVRTDEDAALVSARLRDRLRAAA